MLLSACLHVCMSAGQGLVRGRRHIRAGKVAFVQGGSGQVRAGNRSRVVHPRAICAFGAAGVLVRVGCSGPLGALGRVLVPMACLWCLSPACVIPIPLIWVGPDVVFQPVVEGLHHLCRRS